MPYQRATYELLRGAIPPVPEFVPGAETLRGEDGRVFARIWTSGTHRLIHLPRLAIFRCSTDGTQVTATREPGVPRDAVSDAFRRFVVPLQLFFAGHEILHASAVRSAGGVVGFAASASTGKSTLAYGLGTHGFPLWADDALALDVGCRLRALPVPFDPRLRPESARFFATPALRPPSDLPVEGETAPVAALAVIKRIADRKAAVQIRRLTGGRAFDEVVKHAYRLDLRTNYKRRKKLVENYMKIVASAPVYEIGFRAGFNHFDSVLEVIADLLRSEFGPAS